MNRITMLLAVALTMALLFSTTAYASIEKDDILLKLPKNNKFKVRTVKYKTMGDDGQIYYDSTNVQFLEVLKKVSPEGYAVAKEKLGNGKLYQIDPVKLRAFDIDGNGFVTMVEFSAVLDGVNLSDSELATIAKALEETLKKESDSGGNGSSGGSGGGGDNTTGDW